jgi:hypothetical protein
MIDEMKIREVFAESGKMTVRDMMQYIEHRYSGQYDKKLARKNAKELVEEMRKFI